MVHFYSIQRKIGNVSKDVDNGSKIDGMSQHGESALMLAAESGHEAVTEMLIENAIIYVWPRTALIAIDIQHAFQNCSRLEQILV